MDPITQQLEYEFKKSQLEAKLEKENRIPTLAELLDLTLEQKKD